MSMVMEEPAQVAAPKLAKPQAAIDWLPVGVLFAAIAIAALTYAYFWQHSHDLWWWIVHDRNSHYMYALNLAYDLRTFDLLKLYHDIDRIRVWGILHPILVGAIQFVAGPEYRLAVLPSVVGWVLTMWCAFLIPRRLLESGGNAAGLIAAFLVAVAPAYRAYATDIMYESLGAGLSLAAIYLYLAVVQDGTRRAALLLGVTMTLLFLHKYNYWALVTFGLFVGEFARQPLAWLQYARSKVGLLPGWLVGELKQPLNYIALALASAAIAVVVTGGGVIPVGKWNVSFTEPHNLVHVAYVAFFIRGVLRWRRTGREWSLELPPTLRTFLLCHGGFVAFWFLLPKRLSYFLWYLGPNNDDQRRASVPFMHGLPFYTQGLLDEYFPSEWCMYLFAGAAVIALLAAWKMKRGSLALACFLLVSFYLTCQHPMLKYRFMHSWVAASFVVGAVGLIFFVDRLARLVTNDLRSWATGITCVLLIGLHAPIALDPGHAQEGGLKAQEPSVVRLTEGYLPALADAQRPAITSNISARFLWTWTFIEQHRHQRVYTDFKNLRSFEDPANAKHWLDSTPCDALVLIDIRQGTPFYWKTKEMVDLTTFRKAVDEHSGWAETRRWETPDASIGLWTRTSARAQR